MEINQIVSLIEDFAQLETQESWDCSGFQIDLGVSEVKKILLCLSVTQSVLDQAIVQSCNLIIAHHPLFFVPFSFKKNVSIYSAHTNLDKAEGGTTDTLIELLGFDKSLNCGPFLRVVELKEELLLKDFIKTIKEKLNLSTVRVVNNFNKQNINKIAFCAGSGADFLQEAEAIGADILVTGDVKYHQALESNAIMIDIGHFESEHPVAHKMQNLLKPLNIEVIIADEKGPFINY